VEELEEAEALLVQGVELVALAQLEKLGVREVQALS
jgi:hypothetical protein